MTHQNADQHAQWVESMVAQFEGRLLRYAAQIVGDVETGRDVVQETFLKLCRENREKLAGREAEWLYTVCRNRAFDICRKEKRMHSITDEQSASQASREEPQATAAERQDTAQYVYRLVDGLSDNQREVIRLKFQDGLSYKEISRITSLSVSNVGYLIHTAIRSLRNQLELEA